MRWLNVSRSNTTGVDGVSLVSMSREGGSFASKRTEMKSIHFCAVAAPSTEAWRCSGSNDCRLQRCMRRWAPDCHDLHTHLGSAPQECSKVWNNLARIGNLAPSFAKPRGQPCGGRALESGQTPHHLPLREHPPTTPHPQFQHCTLHRNGSFRSSTRALKDPYTVLHATDSIADVLRDCQP